MTAQFGVVQRVERGDKVNWSHVRGERGWGGVGR